MEILNERKINEIKVASGEIRIVIWPEANFSDNTFALNSSHVIVSYNLV